MNLAAIVPELIVAGLCLVLVPLAGFTRRRLRWLPAWLCGTGLVVAFVMTARMLPWAPTSAFDGIYAVDGFAHIFKLLILLAALLVLVALASYLRGHALLPHAPAALLFSTLGALALASSVDLLLVVLFLQMMSMATYVLAALVRTSRLALEAGLKIFIYAAAALAMASYGFTFFYGLTGTLHLDELGAALAGIESPWLAFAFVLVLIGYGFEITLVPFHVWAPDVYDGATAPVSGFLSVAPKIAGFAALLRLLLHALPAEATAWPLVLAGGAALTMTLGNLTALRQQGLKRLLAYSSIGHAGFVLMAVAVAARTNAALPAIAYHLAAYLLMNLGAFLAVAAIGRGTGNDAIVAVRGLGRVRPGVAVAFGLCLLSLAGIPPLAGFVGKVLLLEATIDGGFTWLAVLAAANMVIALWYYVRVIAEMFLFDSCAGALPDDGIGMRIALSACVIGTVLLGVWPGPFLASLAEVAERLAK